MERIDLDHRDVAACSYALIDPLCVGADDMDAWKTFPQYELTPRGCGAHAERLPLLMDLRNVSSEQFVSLVGLVLDRPISISSCVALLQTVGSVDRLQRRFRKLLAPRFPTGKQGMFLFHDPVVFEHLSWMLDAREMAGLLGPIDRWILPLRNKWHAFGNPGSNIQRSLEFRLPVETWSRVYRIGPIHAVLSANPTWLDDPTEWGPRANTLLVRAEQHQLTKREDAVAFAVHGLRWHPHLDKHPRVAEALSRCIGHPVRYQRLTGAWSDADWQAIAAEIEASDANGEPSIRPNHPPQGAC